MSTHKANAFVLNILKFSILFTFFAMLLQTRPSEARKLRRIIPKTTDKTHSESHKNTSRNSAMIHSKKSSEKLSKLSDAKVEKQNILSRSYLSSRITRRHSDARTELLKEAILTLPQLQQLLAPIKWRGSIDGMIGPSNYGHLRGTVRLKRLYCRVGIGYHLEINERGKVSARHLPTSNGIMEIFSVKRRVVGIRSVAHRGRYLCIKRSGRIVTRHGQWTLDVADFHLDRTGLLMSFRHRWTSCPSVDLSSLQFLSIYEELQGQEINRRFQPSCEFRENLEGNRFNTYASERYSNHERREGYFLAINRNGNLPKRLKKVSWKQKRAHWLPRSV